MISFSVHSPLPHLEEAIKSVTVIQRQEFGWMKQRTRERRRELRLLVDGQVIGSFPDSKTLDNGYLLQSTHF